MLLSDATMATPKLTLSFQIEFCLKLTATKMWLLMIYVALAANAKEFTHSFHCSSNSHTLGEGFSERLFLSSLILQPEMLVLIQFERCLWFNLVFSPPSHFMQ